MTLKALRRQGGQEFCPLAPVRDAFERCFSNQMRVVFLVATAVALYHSKKEFFFERGPLCVRHKRYCSDFLWDCSRLTGAWLKRWVNTVGAFKVRPRGRKDLVLKQQRAEPEIKRARTM